MILTTSQTMIDFAMGTSFIMGGLSAHGDLDKRICMMLKTYNTKYMQWNAQRQSNVFILITDWFFL